MPSRGPKKGGPRTKEEARPAAPPRFASDEVPLYYQLGSILREKILSGSFAAGDRLPTEAELGDDFGISRITVRQALEALETEGLIRREKGRGTFVTGKRPFDGTLKMEGSLDDLIAMGLVTKVEVLDLQTVPASQEEAVALAVAPGALLTRCTRLRYNKSEPYSYIVNFLPHEIGKRVKRSDWKGSILRLLEEELGIPLRDARQSVRAALADAQLARLLNTRIGAPLLAIDRVVMTDGGRPVERVQTYYRSDIYSFNVHLTRDHSRAKAGWAVGSRKKS